MWRYILYVLLFIVLVHPGGGPLLSVIVSEEQGFGNPCGYIGKGLEGRGKGMECLTSHKPLPLTEGKGIPSLLLAGKSHDVCRHLPHHKHVINKQMFPFSMTTFITTHPVTTFTNHHHLWQLLFNHPPPPHHCTLQWWWQCGNTMSQAPYAYHFRQHMVNMT